jgi:predicted negative regulator of RcsB-dependent stress response
VKKLIAIAIVGLLGWYGYNKYQVAVDSPLESESQSLEQAPRSLLPADPTRSTTFACDGRTHCSQMTSCAEATYFLKNCPGVKMDGDNDGVPCEQQWCR